MIILGDCVEQLKKLKPNSVHSIVTDPPYGLEFMGKDWDKFGATSDETKKDGSDDMFFRGKRIRFGKGQGAMVAFQEFTLQWATECLRVLKPGGYLLSFGGSRTYHRMAVAIEDAGFEIRDQIMWVYGSGFPKSLNIGKQVDKLQGNEREVVGHAKSNPDLRDVGRISKENCGIDKLSFGQGQGAKRQQTPIDKGNSKWEGWGTALKPAHEPIVVARKPLSEKNVASNVLKHGTGGINIDGCRVGTDGGGTHCDNRDENGKCKGHKDINDKYGETIHADNNGIQGRFPANFIHDGSDEVVELFPDSKSSDAVRKNNKRWGDGIKYGKGNAQDSFGFNDSGSAARFFYCAKSSKAERNKGLEGFEEKEQRAINLFQCPKCKVQLTSKRTVEGYCVHCGNIKPETANFSVKNNHPTVKPISLMRYLCRLVTPKDGTVLDPFMGSGTTGVAAKIEGLNFIGIEKEKEYYNIAQARIKAWEKEAKQQTLI